MIWLGAIAAVVGVFCVLALLGMLHNLTAAVREQAASTKELAVAQAAGLSLARAQVEMHRQLVELARARQSTIATAMGDPAAKH